MNRYRIAKHIRQDGDAYYSIECQSDENLEFWKWHTVNEAKAHFIADLECAREILEQFRDKERRADRARIIRVEYLDA